jgi:hypothetical protein
MSNILASIHITNILSLVVFPIIWIVLFEGAHLLLTLLRNETPIGWAIGPLGVTIMFLREPSTLYILLNVLFPALVSGSILYIGLFTSLAPVAFPHNPLLRVVLMIFGVLLFSLRDAINTLRDLRHPLWGEARILWSIQCLRASWAAIHFTPFGRSYMLDHFGSNPTDLLQAF